MKTMKAVKVKEVVRKAAKLMDKLRPCWAAKIDLHMLNIGSCDFCVLGQVYDGFGKAPRELQEAQAFAGDVPCRARIIKTFGLAWRKEIKARLVKK